MAEIEYFTHEYDPELRWGKQIEFITYGGWIKPLLEIYFKPNGLFEMLRLSREDRILNKLRSIAFDGVIDG